MGMGLLVSRLAQPAMSFVLFALVARLLPLAELGTYVLLMGLLFIFQAGAMLGLGPLITREVALDNSATGSWLSAAVLLLVPTALLNWLLFPACVSLMGYKGMALLGGLILGGSLPFSAGIQTAEAVFLAHGRATAIAIENMVENAVRVVLSLILLFLGYGLIALLMAHVLSRATGFCLSMALLRPLVRTPWLTWDWNRARTLLAGVPTFGLMTVAAIICFRLDVIMLSVMRNETEVGLYGAAYRLLALAFLVPESLVSAMFPVLSCSLQERRQEARDLVVTGMQLLLTLELPLCLAVAALAWWLMPLIFGSAFADASLVLMVLIFTLLPHSLNGLLGFLLQGDRQEKTALWLILGALGGNLILDFFLIRWLGMMGAAWGTLLSFSLGAGVHLWVVNRKVFPLDLLQPFMRLLGAGLVGLVALFGLKGAGGFSLLPPLVCLLALIIMGALSKAWLGRAWALIAQRGN